MTRILLVEDDREFAATIGADLEREGYEVAIATSGANGLAHAESDSPDLIILDLMLSAMSGFRVLERLREAERRVPVLIMTAHGDAEDTLRGSGLGENDYVVKPCGSRALLARVRLLLGRAGAGEETRSTVRVGDLTIDFAARTVCRGEANLALRPKEFDLLAALVRHRGEVVSRADLLCEVWGYARDAKSRTVETHLAALRQRLGDDPQAPRYIATIRRAGYRLGG